MIINYAAILHMHVMALSFAIQAILSISLAATNTYG